jgi:hypothetical protein
VRRLEYRMTIAAEIVDAMLVDDEEKEVRPYGYPLARPERACASTVSRAADAMQLRASYGLVPLELTLRPILER